MPRLAPRARLAHESGRGLGAGGGTAKRDIQSGQLGRSWRTVQLANEPKEQRNAGAVRSLAALSLLIAELAKRSGGHFSDRIPRIGRLGWLRPASGRIEINASRRQRISGRSSRLEESEGERRRAKERSRGGRKGDGAWRAGVGEESGRRAGDGPVINRIFRARPFRSGDGGCGGCRGDSRGLAGTRDSAPLE
jgi:hypothetical protein